MRSIDDLLQDAKWATLSQEEIDYVANRIQLSSPENQDPRLTTLIYILGHANATQYRKLLENFLYYPSDPEISNYALMSLAALMGLTEEYMKELKQFLHCVPWDHNRDVQYIAISIAGWYLEDHDDIELLETLINIFEDTSIKWEIRGHAYSHLAKALGRRMRDILGEDKEVDWSVIAEAKERLKKMKAKLGEKKQFINFQQVY